MLLSNEVYHHGIFFLDNYSGSNKHIRRLVFFFSSRKAFELISEQSSKHVFESGFLYFLYAYVCSIIYFLNVITLCLDVR